MMRWLYSLVWLLGMPLVLARLAWRARRQPDYLAHLAERFGRVPPPSSPCIWVHAVSVGETRAAQPLIKALLREFPAHSILLTHMTPTGRATGRELFGGEARVRQAWLPYDLPWLARSFLTRARPRAGVVMETEVWPNLMHQAHRSGVPVLLANARLSARSAAGYGRLGALSREAFGSFRHIAAQSVADAERLQALAGARAQLSVAGNIKYDVTIPADMEARGRAFRALAGDRPVVLLASTREGEEALLLEAFRALAGPDVLLVLVPRHPQRFDEVAALLERLGLAHERRSSDLAIGPATRVWLGDSMGEMAAYYAMADVSLIGGSWLPFGSQNLIESCAAGVPVMIGPHSYNFAEAAEKAVAAGAAIRCADATMGMQQALALLADASTRKAMSEAGRAFCAQHRGATEKLVALVKQMMSSTDA